MKKKNNSLIQEQNFQIGLGITYLLTYIHSFKSESNDKTPVSPKLFDMGASREKFRSVRSRKWGPTAPPATTLLNFFSWGPPLRAQKPNSRFHKELIQGVFFPKSPGHLLTRQPATDSVWCFLLPPIHFS